jgi:hypothetical protein
MDAAQSLQELTAPRARRRPADRPRRHYHRHPAPVHEGRAFLWRPEAGQTQTEIVEYGPTSEGEAAENWRRSVFFHLLQTDGSLFRVRFHANETDARRRNERRRRDDHPFPPFGGQSARWTRFIPIGRPTVRTASTMGRWRR